MALPFLAAAALIAVAVMIRTGSRLVAATGAAALRCLMIHLRTRLALTPCAIATPDTDAPRASHAATTWALNSSLWRRFLRPLPALLSARSISMVSTFFMVDTIAFPRYSFKVGLPDAYKQTELPNPCRRPVTSRSFPKK